jgi:hypothetical protein
MPSIERLIAIVVLCLAAAPTYAQTPPETRRTFVDVSFGPHWDDLYDGSNRAPDATWASGLALGVDTGRWGLELSLTVPQWHEKQFPLHKYLYAGPTFGWQQRNHRYESSSMVRRRSIDVTTLARANRVINRRVTLTWLIGGGYVFRPTQSTGITREVQPDGRLIEVHVRKETSSRDYLAAATRLDVELAVTSRVSIVPRVRVTIFPSLFDDSGGAPRIVVARPEVAVRWRFQNRSSR